MQADHTTSASPTPASPTIARIDHDAVILLVRRGQGSPRRLETLRAAVAARLRDISGFDGPVVLAFTELAVPAVSGALGDLAGGGHRTVLLVDLVVPAEMSLRGWLPGALHDWAQRHAITLDISFSAPVEGDPLFIDAIAARIAASDHDNIRNSPAIDTRPSWNDPPDHAHHIFACDGPRCAHRGSGPVWTALLAALEAAGLRAKATDRVMMTRSRCLFPCNRGPVLTLHPGGYWCAVPDAAAAARIVDEHLKQGRPVGDLLFRAAT
ncbi:hypothetical protein GCM10011505_09070 [Tistrella bauzanensis]|uniref:Ferredoxin n=1 Tax=Tistrella bauzanensis TaxID=657419 RepID=A0ABQ1I9E9_9PROT|nr:hypothetical protein [Tistrella bauzanensis]GGB29881.1 hypothetical protein GCM10011505_09070 [Tistrella bauzanensis]